MGSPRRIGLPPRSCLGFGFVATPRVGASAPRLRGGGPLHRRAGDHSIGACQSRATRSVRFLADGPDPCHCGRGRKQIGRHGAAMSDPSTQISTSQEATESAFETAYPPKLREGEHALLTGRRGKAGLPWSPGQLVGFGLSGGGIRSATFALGLFQRMARRGGLLRQTDYISTVSGGGYFGSFFGRLLTREYVKTADDVEKVLSGEEKPQVLGFLRENGRYMSPNGAGDSLLFGAVVLRNWVSVQLVMLLFVLALFLGLQVLRSGLEVFLSNPQLAQTDGMIWW